MLKNEMESYVRIGEEFEKSYVPLHGGRVGQNLPNNPYVINKWPLTVVGKTSSCSCRTGIEPKTANGRTRRRLCS